MTITRAEVEAILVRRCGRLLNAASMDGTTVNGSNADLNDPLGAAIRECGGTVASVTAVADADLSTITPTDYNKFFDLAELRVLENIQNNLTLVDITSGPFRESLGQIGTRVQKAVEAKRAQVEKAYGVGAQTLQAGVITLPLAQHGDDDE